MPVFSRLLQYPMIRVGSIVWLSFCLLLSASRALNRCLCLQKVKVIISSCQFHRHNVQIRRIQRHRRSLPVVKLNARGNSEEETVPVVPDQKKGGWQSWSGFLILNLIAVLWGSQHVVIKSAVEDLPVTSLLNAWRFTLSALLFSPSLVQVVVSTMLAVFTSHLNFYCHLLSLLDTRKFCNSSSS